ncbi:MAG: ABC transporter permease [Bdellovibrionota bacterium]
MLWRIAWRSLWRHRRRTLITVVSIALGITAVVFFLSLAEGVYAQLINDAVRMQGGHVALEHPDYRDAPAVDLRVQGAPQLAAKLAVLPEVERTKLLVLGQGIARSGTGAVGVAILGVEPSAEKLDSPLARKIVAGRYLDEKDGPWVVVGRHLAERLSVAEGKKIVITTNDASGALVDALFRVRGIFETGSEEVDGYLVQAPLSHVQSLYGLSPEEATQVAVVLRDPDQQQEVFPKVEALVDSKAIAVRGWQEVFPDLAAFIRLDRVSDRTFEGLLLCIVLFTIFNTILMSVLDREREFAVLLAIGTPPGKLRLQILIESLYIGLIGCSLGVLSGGLLAHTVEVRGWDVSSFYPEGVTISGLAISTRVHARLTAGILVWVGGLIFLATLLLSALPMRRAARVRVAELLR